MGKYQQKNVWLFVYAMSVLAHLFLNSKMRKTSDNNIFSHYPQYLMNRYSGVLA